MNVNRNIISENQSIPLKTEAINVIEGIDFNVNGALQFRAPSSPPFVLNGSSAVQNTIFFWLSSEVNDYYRRSGFGAPLDPIIGKTITSGVIADFRAQLEAFFNNNFGNTLLLASLDITPNTEQRIIEIRMGITDLVRREFQEVAVGVQA